MKRILISAVLFFAALAALPPDAESQNMTTVSASNITDASGNKLPAGKVLFQPTDSKGNHIPIQIGGGGMIVDYQACALVVTGAITTQCPPNSGTFQVANPGATIPSGVYYQVTIQDAFGGVRTIPNVTWSGGTFNLDTFIPATGSVPVATASSIDHLQAGQLDVFRNLLLYGTCTGCLGGSVMVNNTLMASPFAALNLANGAGITVTDAGSGKAQFAFTALTAKGDLLGFGTVLARLSVGTDGQILIADSTQTLGVKWGAAPSGVTLQHNASNNTSQTTLNLKDGTGSTVTNPSAGDVQVNVIYGSGANTAAVGNDARITGAEQTANKGVASGYAGLDGAAHQLCAQEPALTGDATSPAGSCAMTLPNIATAGTGIKTTINAKGQATAVATAATTDLSDNSVIVKNNQANTYTAGSKQTVQANATTAGFNFAGVSADPSSLSNGDAWHRSDLSGFFARLGGATHQFALFSSLPTNGNCVNASIVASAVFLGDAGAPCGAGGGGANPAGSGSEINARLNGTTFQAVTGSSTSGGNIALGAGNGFFAGNVVVPGFSVVRTDATHLSIGAECAVSGVNCVGAFGPLKRCSFNSGTMPATLTISGGQSVDVRLGVTSACTLQADYNGTLTLSGTNITPTNTASDPDDGSFYLFYIWPTNSVSGQFDAAGTEQRASFNSRPYTFNGGLNKSYNSSTGMTTVSLSTPVVTGNGGTNVGSSGAAGNYLRSDGSNWTSSALLAGDLPSVPPIASIPVDSGAVNAYVIAPSPAFTSLANGDIAYFVTANANTGASTINVNGLGVKNITKKGATPLVSGDILAGSPKAIYKLVYDGTEWQLINPSTSGGAGTVTSITAGAGLTGGTITTSGTIALSTPVTAANGGTGAATFSAQTVLAGPSAYGAAAAAQVPRVLAPQDLPAGTLSCGVLDTAICSSAVDANGRPNFLSGSGAAITVNGGTTPLTYFVGGIYQQINANISVTCATPAATSLMFLYAQADTAVANPVAGDLFCASNAPFTQKAAPTCPSPSPALSASNPSVWWNLAKNETDTCTANAGSYAKATQPMILLGVAVVTSTPTTTDVLAEPYLLNPSTRFKMFGSGAQGSLSLTSGTTTKDGVQMYQSVMLNGATLNHTAPTTANNSPGLILVSQTPVIIDNTSSLTAAGKGGTLVNGGTGAGSTGKTGGFFAGGGGGGGGGTGNAGGTGGGRIAFIGTTAIGGGGGGSSGSGVGTAGTAADTGQGHPAFNNCLNVVMGIGGGGAAGGGDGTNGGGGGKEGGGAICVQAPAFLLASGSTFSCAGNNGAAGGAGNIGGGGGGGGGVCIINTSNLQIAGTVTAAGGTHGNAVGTGGNGGDGGAGIAQQNELW